jgi:ABC-2 type transport system permease protein
MSTEPLKQTAPHPRSGSYRARPMSGAHAAWLVAEREITTRVRSKAFLISAATLILLVLGGVLFMGFAANSGGIGGPTKVAAVGEASVALEGSGFEVTDVQDRAAAEKLVLGGDVEAAVVPDGNSAVGLTVLAKDGLPVSVVQALSVPPQVELLEPSDADPSFAAIVALAFGLVFFFSAMTFGITIAQSVVEEKQTRIVEILLATVSAPALLAGKIIGNSVLALAQVLAVLVAATVGMLATGQDLLLGDLGASLVWFLVLFAAGFVLLAAMYAALAALVSRQEDIGSATSPVTTLVMIPYVAIILFYNNSQILTLMSYIPFSSPVGMPMRVFLGTADWWEPIVSLGVLVATIAVVVWIGARIYSNSILRTGSRVKLVEAIRG